MKNMNQESKNYGKFKFYPVGQGLFYSGRIQIGNQTIRIVYDCGSFFDNNLLKSEIEHAFSMGETLDVLMLSHMDEDHICGLPYLLNRVQQVSFLFMPYTEPEDFLLYAGQYGVGKDGGEHESYIQMVSTISSIFRDEKIKNIIMLTENTEDGGFPLEVYRPMDGVTPKFHSDDSKQESLAVDPMLSPKIKVAKCKGTLSVQGAWKFMFYVMDKKGTARRRFHEELVRRGLSIRSFSDIYSILSGIESRRRLVQAYKALNLSNLNLSTMMVLHRPISVDMDLFRGYIYGCRKCFITRRCWDCRNSFSVDDGQRVGTALLGDAQLKFKTSVRKVRDFFKDDLKNCLVALVPHHGSKNSWNKLLMTYVEDCTAWVISFGIHGRFGHPNTEVLRDFQCSWEYIHRISIPEKKKNSQLLFCNEYQCVCYSISFQTR